MECINNQRLENKNLHMLSAFNSFLFGAGSILDLYGTYYFLSLNKSDGDSLRGDWETIGNDIKSSMVANDKSVSK